MYQQSWWSGAFVFSVLLFVSGCATQQSPAPTSTGQVQQSIPADSPLAKIREGMSKAEMLSLLGPPTDQDMSITGKTFIPFYFGGDVTATRMHYRGLGRVYVSGYGTLEAGKRCSKLSMTHRRSDFDSSGAVPERIAAPQWYCIYFLAWPGTFPFFRSAFQQRKG